MKDGKGEVEKLPDENLKIDEKEETEEISDWKTYRNEEYGFEVKYPKEWSTTNPNTQFNKSKGSRLPPKLCILAFNFLLRKILTFIELNMKMYLKIILIKSFQLSNLSNKFNLIKPARNASSFMGLA